MGFSQDWQELQINLDHMRWGPRIVQRERMNAPYEGVRPELPQQPRRPTKERSKTDVEPGYNVKYQRRLW